MTGHERLIVDAEGQPLSASSSTSPSTRGSSRSVEELAHVRAYDEAKASGEQPIPWEQARKELERDEE